MYLKKINTLVILSPSPLVILSEVKNLMRSAQDKFRKESLVGKPNMLREANEVFVNRFFSRSSFRMTWLRVLSPPVGR